VTSTTEVPKKAKVSDDDASDAIPITSVIAMKAGQSKPTPTTGDGDRVFYESLYKQTNGESHMAQKWCVENGVLDAETAKTVYKKVLARRGIAAKAPSPKPKDRAAPPAKKARIIDDTGGDIGEGMATGGFETMTGGALA
jgi:hypothetical protein